MNRNTIIRPLTGIALGLAVALTGLATSCDNKTGPIDDPNEVRQRSTTFTVSNQYGLSGTITVQKTSNLEDLNNAAKEINDRLHDWLALFGSVSQSDIETIWQPIFNRGIIYIVEENAGPNLYVVDNRTIRIAPSAVGKAWVEDGIMEINNNNSGPIGFDTSRETLHMAKKTLTAEEIARSVIAQLPQRTTAAQQLALDTAMGRVKA